MCTMLARDLIATVLSRNYLRLEFQLQHSYLTLATDQKLLLSFLHVQLWKNADCWVFKLFFISWIFLIFFHFRVWNQKKKIVMYCVHHHVKLGHSWFLEPWNREKSLCNVWHRFSYLLVKWIAKISKIFFFHGGFLR